MAPSTSVGGIRPGIGPLPDEGADEALGLAVGLRSVWSSPGLAALAEGAPIGPRAIRPGVVGHDPLHLDPRSPERGQGELERGHSALGALVGDGDDDAPSAAIIDDDLEVVVAGAPLQTPALGRPPEDAVAAAVGDPAQLLVILVDEGSRMTRFVAANGQARRPIEVGQAGHARA